MSDDGLCHICRQSPRGQSRFYSLSTCEECGTQRLSIVDLSSIQGPLVTEQQAARQPLGPSTEPLLRRIEATEAAVEALRDIEEDIREHASGDQDDYLLSIANHLRKVIEKAKP